MLDEVSLAKYIEQAVKLRLAGHELLLCRTIPEILRSANGIGPEAFPDKLRRMIDNANPTMIIASIIHDLRYTYGTGTRADFLQANADLEINGCLLAEDNYSWYNPIRYWVKFKAHEFRKACDKFGWPAYCAAIEMRKKDPNIPDKSTVIGLK